MSPPRWEKYVARLCLDAWSFDPASLLKVIADIESLVEFGHVNDAAIATVLCMAGIPQPEAEFIAPSICVAIGVSDPDPDLTEP